MKLSGIQNIIFDFGGVILNIDHLRPIEAFRKLGIPDFENLYSQAIQADLFDRLEKGTISPDAFRTSLKQICPIPLSDTLLDEAWNAILLDIPLFRIQLLEKLKTRYRTFLLSNSNQIHYDVYLETLRSTSGHPDFDALFEKAYFSFNMGMRKPDAEIFKFVLHTHHLIPEETLFIDDSIQHIQGAQQCGLKTYWLQAPVGMTDIFDPETLVIIDLPE